MSYLKNIEHIRRTKETEAVVRNLNTQGLFFISVFFQRLKVIF